MEENKMILDVNEKPTILKWIVLAIQHVFAMFGATVLVPILVNSAAGETVLTIPVALVASGIGTLLYILCTKGKSPVYLGSSFAFIAPLAAAYLKGGISGAMTGVMVVGLIYIVVATIIHFTGKTWLEKLLPPVVIGPMIMIIGLGLAPSAVSQMGLSSGVATANSATEISIKENNYVVELGDTYSVNPDKEFTIGTIKVADKKDDTIKIDEQLDIVSSAENLKIEKIVDDEGNVTLKGKADTKGNYTADIAIKNGEETFKLAPVGVSVVDETWKVILVALATFIITAVVMTMAKGFLKVIPFLVGIAGGYIVAVIVGLVDFAPVIEAAWFSIPSFVVPFVHYTPNFSALITIAPIALVTMCEHIGDHTSLSNIIGKDLIKDPGLDRTLLGDGLATFVAGAIGGPANTTYGENTSVVGLTKVASVWVIGLAAIIAIAIGFFGKFTALVSTIPPAVLGGVSLLLYGFIAVNGLKVLIKNQINFEEPKNVVVASSMLVLGLGGAVISIISGDLAITISGMSLSAVVGILLNLFIPAQKAEKVELKKDKKSKKEKVKA